MFFQSLSLTFYNAHNCKFDQEAGWGDETSGRVMIDRLKATDAAMRPWEKECVEKSATKSIGLLIQ